MMKIRRKDTWRVSVAGIVFVSVWGLGEGAGLTARAQEQAQDTRVITEQNLFHPSRTLPAPPKAEPPKSVPVANPVPPPPKPQPKFELSGVVMDDDSGVAWALLAEPQWTQGKPRIIGPGEMVGPYRVVSIAQDHAILAEEGEPPIRIPLSGPPRPPVPVTVGAPPPIQSAPQVTPGAAAASGSAGPLSRERVRPPRPEEPPEEPPRDQKEAGAASSGASALPSGFQVRDPTSVPPPPPVNVEDFRRQIERSLKGTGK